MRLAVAGLSHHTAPLDVREQVALGSSGVQAALYRLRTVVPEAVVLSTCNRTELYLVVHDSADVASVFESALPAQTLAYRSYLFTSEGEAVARHLFHVASGADSVVFGEGEILGQIGRAWELARAVGTAGALTSRLFQQAVAVGKRVRSETPIGRLPASFSSAAVALAQRVFGRDLSQCTVLLIGTGEMGQGVARCLLEHGVQRLMVANHRVAGAELLAERYKAEALPWPIPPTSLAQVDIVISATGAPEAVLGLVEVRAAMPLRSQAPWHLIDLALPRDIDPAVAQLPGVHLHNLDDIETVVAATVEYRQQTQPEVEAIVAEEASSFAQWLREREVFASVQALRAKAEAIRSAELARALRKLGNLSERELAVVDRLASRLVNKLLHAPTTRLRSAAGAGRGGEYQRVVGELFDLDGIPVTEGQTAQNQA